MRFNAGPDIVETFKGSIKVKQGGKNAELTFPAAQHGIIEDKATYNISDVFKNSRGTDGFTKKAQ